MAITYDGILHLAKPDDGNQAWGTAMRQNMDVLGALSAPHRCYMVSPSYTDANLHNASATTPRQFSTIQAAIDAIPAQYQNADYYTVLVGPGLYNENLTITKSVHICGLTPIMGRTMAGAQGASLQGTTGTIAPTISIIPPESNWICVQFSNLYLGNAHNGGTYQINSGHLLRVYPQTLYGAYGNYIGFQGCDCRLQTWGQHNDWQAGLMIAGWNVLSMRACDISAFDYAGSMYDGGINSLLHLTGSATKLTSARLINCHFSSDYAGAYTAPALFKLDSGAAVTLAQSSIYKTGGAYAVLGGTGTNTMAGIGVDLVNGTPATAAAYCNILGVDLANL